MLTLLKVNSLSKNAGKYNVTTSYIFFPCFALVLVLIWKAKLKKHLCMKRIQQIIDFLRVLSFYRQLGKSMQLAHSNESAIILCYNQNQQRFFKKKKRRKQTCNSTPNDYMYIGYELILAPKNYYQISGK